MKKLSQFSNLELYNLFTKAFSKLNVLLKEENYFKGFILAFSILEDRVTTACITLNKLMNLKKNEIPMSLVAKARILMLTKWLTKTNYDSLRKIAKKRNSFIHAYFLGDFEINKKDVIEIIRLIRAIDKKHKSKKKKPVKKTVAKKVAVKKPAAKKTTKTAIDTVLAIIRRSKKGVSAATLKKKTGFNERLIHNNVYKLKKQGKIKSVGKGVYLKA